jgi:hypothetical protein
MEKLMPIISTWKLFKRIQADLLQLIFNLIGKEIKYTSGHLVWAQVMEEEVKTILHIKEILQECSIQETPKMTLRMKMQLKRENNQQVKWTSNSEREIKLKCRRKKFKKNKIL